LPPPVTGNAPPPAEFSLTFGHFFRTVFELEAGSVHSFVVLSAAPILRTLVDLSIWNYGSEER
jgi:hypothetical protein